MALISVLRQQALELENGGLERERGGLRHPNQLPAGLSPGVRAVFAVCAFPAGWGTGGPTTRFAGARGEDAAGGLSLILPRNRPRSCRGILTNGKRAMASQRRGKGEKESRVEVEQPFQSRFGVWPVIFILRVILRSGLFLRELFFFQYLHININ